MTSTTTYLQSVFSLIHLFVLLPCSLVAPLGELSGIEGRLGSLGRIDAKYDIAISNATGYLDHIVVKTTGTKAWRRE